MTGSLHGSAHAAYEVALLLRGQVDEVGAEADHREVGVEHVGVVDPQRVGTQPHVLDVEARPPRARPGSRRRPRKLTPYFALAGHLHPARRSGSRAGPGRRSRTSRRAPGRITAARLAKSRSWSSIQWNAATLITASTGSVERERLRQVGDVQLGRVAELGTRLLDHPSRAVDTDEPCRRASARAGRHRHGRCRSRRRAPARRPRDASGRAPPRPTRRGGAAGSRRSWRPTREVPSQHRGGAIDDGAQVAARQRAEGAVVRRPEP